MTDTLDYGFKKTFEGSADEVEERVKQALAAEGFGVLTRIDVEATMKAKLDVAFRPYRILGACNPTLAHGALSQETDIGLLLPCNVVVYEGDKEGEAVVAILDPVKQLGIAGRPDMAPLAGEVRARMERVLDRI